MAACQTTQTELAVIGAGLAGMAATIFASQQGITAAQIGVSGGILYASGCLDLLGVHPIDRQTVWEDPWRAMDRLISDTPNHPYARLSKTDIRESIRRFTGFMETIGLPYRNADGNVRVITSVGATRPTYCVPAAMWNGVEALAGDRPLLLVDFWGLRGYSAVQIAEMQRGRRKGIETARIAFPQAKGSMDLYPEHLARALEVEENVDRLADEIAPHVNGAGFIGLPAILGIYKTSAILSRLEDRLECGVFEIPTMPPGISGLRIKERVDAALSGSGVQLFSQKRVTRVEPLKTGGFVLDIGGLPGEAPEHRIAADGVILASGRFLGMGLRAGRKKIQETLFGLPVFQPADRSDWHEKDFFDPRGHQINLAGLEIDDHFHPIGEDGQAAFQHLFAAGSILAHQDWIRQKCGAGLSIATAWGAVRAFMNR